MARVNSLSRRYVRRRHHYGDCTAPRAPTRRTAQHKPRDNER